MSELRVEERLRGRVGARAQREESTASEQGRQLRLVHRQLLIHDPHVSDSLAPYRPGLPKALEYFYYFKITDIDRFKAVFKSFILPKIVTSYQLVYNKPPSPRDNPNHPFRGLNVAFSSLGLTLFGIDPAQLGDDAFLRGQLADARSLGDAGAARGDGWSPDWDPEFKANIHGLFLITAYNEPNAQSFIQEIEDAFQWSPGRSSIKKILNFHGYPRPGAEGINDPFGWRGGGFTNPQVQGITFTDKVQYTGTPVIPIGVIVIGRDGDDDASTRPEWAKDGSLIATRKLNCLVPELDKYLASEGPRLFPNLSAQAAAAKLGARLMGRWKNGKLLLATAFVVTPFVIVSSQFFPSRNIRRHVTRQRRA